MYCPLEQGVQEHTDTHTALQPLLCVLVCSQPLNVPVLLPQDGNLVSEQHWVQPHLGVH